jgi:hypothetical protein
MAVGKVLGLIGGVEVARRQAKRAREVIGGDKHASATKEGREEATFY